MALDTFDMLGNQTPPDPDFIFRPAAAETQAK
jgi:hypothetical protein